MPERYPDDATLLALSQDAATGVEYIPTGRSPYHLEFRKMLQRLLVVAERANDLRVYPDGDLTIGVRPGRSYINDGPHDYTGTTDLAVTPNATTHIWLDSTGTLQTGTSGLPSDRTTFVPLAEIVTDATTITSLTDLRGESFLLVPTLATLGLSATIAEINQALSGINATVDSLALNTLTGGPTSTADSEHRHLQVLQDADSEVYFILFNNNSGSSANVGLVLSVPNVLADDLVLLPNLNNGFLSQRFNGETYNFVGTAHAQFAHEGNLVASQTNKIMGIVPIDGVVTNVILSLGTNLVTDTSTDGISATAKVNSVALTSTDPQITVAAGAGFRSTAQGSGTAAVIKSDGTENVQRGDVLTVDITRTVVGTVTNEASNIIVLVVIRADQPE